MGILQNLRLWENNVTYINEQGETATRRVPRVMPPPPWKILAMLSRRSYMYFFLGLMAWTADGYDFNAVNLVSTDLAKRYDHSVAAVSLSITLTLLFRSLGACLIGMAADIFGRKWPLFFDLVVLAALQIATAYAPTLNAFIGVRAVFGIFMGGVWGLSAALALENMPTQARGLFSGLLQQGYALGYLIAASINLRAGTTTSVGYRLVFFVGAGFTFCIALCVLLVPESNQYRAEASMPRPNFHTRYSSVLLDLRLAARQYWPMFLYCILLCMSFNWMSHGAQDVYPNYLKIQKVLGSYHASVATIIGQCGAIAGGAICGHFSQFIGRRLTVVIACCFGMCMIPLWTLPNTFGPLAAGEFFVQAAQNGAWGVMPILLNEYAPPQFRGVFPGTVYQLGNMLSAPAAEIQTVAATHWIKGGKPNYSQVMTIVLCIVFTTTALITASGQERLGSHFEVVERAGGQTNIMRETKELGLDAEDVESETGVESLEKAVREDNAETKGQTRHVETIA